MEFLTLMTVLFAISLESSITTGESDVTVRDNPPCLKGTNHTLTCEFNKRTTSVEWMIGDDVNPIVQCHRNSCLLNPNFVGKCNYSIDPAKNVYNLTILDVGEENNEKKFVCSDGKHHGCTILHVEDPSLEEIESGKVTATSACSSQDMKVSFEWIRIDAESNEHRKFKPKICNQSVTDCPKEECGEKNMKYYTQSICVGNGNGKKYFLKTEVFYGTVGIKSNKTLVAYMIEDQAEIETKHDNIQKIEHNDHVIVVAAAAAAVAAVIIVVIVAVAIRRKLAQRYFHTFFGKAEKPNNPIVRSESGEKRPLNSVDTGAVAHQEKESEAKIAVKGEVIIKLVDGHNNQGSDHDTQVDTGAVTHQEKESEAKIAVKGEVIIQLVDGDNNQGLDHDTPISALEKRARDESFLHTDTLLIM